MPEPETLAAKDLKKLFYTTVGARFKQGRERAGLSSLDIAAVIHKSPQAILQFEKGLPSFGTDAIVAACEAVGLNVRWVLLGRGEMLDPDVRAILPAYPNKRPARRVATPPPGRA